MTPQAKWSTCVAGILTLTLAAPVAWAANEGMKGPEKTQQQSSQQVGNSQQQMVQELESLPTGKDKEFYRQALKERNYQIIKTTLDTEDVLQLEVEKNGQTAALSVGFAAETGKSKQIEVSALSKTEQQMTSTQSQQQQQTDGDVVAKVPVVEEKMQVGKREVQAGGVKVTKEVEEKPVEKQVQLEKEEIDVERRQVNRPLTEEDKEVLQEGEETIVVPKVVEKPVVSKEARVVEEVVITKDQDTREATVQDTVRRTDVDVEKMKGTQQQARATTQESQPQGMQQAENSQQQQMIQELQALPTGKDEAFYRQTLQDKGYEIIDTKSEQQQMEMEVMKEGQVLLVTVQFDTEGGNSTNVTVSPKGQAQPQASQQEQQEQSAASQQQTM